LTIEVPHPVAPHRRRPVRHHHQVPRPHHEHHSYFSLLAADRRTVFDVEELCTHGGLLRLFTRHEAHRTQAITRRLLDLQAVAATGLDQLNFYTPWAPGNGRLMTVR
jgi:hypothetical protein